MASHSLPGQTCTTDSDCTYKDGWEVCNNGHCRHKDIFPLKGLEFWGYIVIFLTLWFVNIGGVPGGGLVVPISIFFFKFDPKNAIALSNFSICASSLIRFFLMAHHTHPLKNGAGRKIDYNLIIVMYPLVVMGVQLGVILNIIMPSAIILIVFAILFLSLDMMMVINTKRAKDRED